MTPSIYGWWDAYAILRFLDMRGKKGKEKSLEGMSLFAACARRHEAPSSVVSSGPAQVRLYLLKPDRLSVNVLVRHKSPQALAFQSSHWRNFCMPVAQAQAFPDVQASVQYHPDIMKTAMLVEGPVSEQEELPVLKSRHLRF